jgi:transcriptional regulator with XRE-family HTH domain
VIINCFALGGLTLFFYIGYILYLAFTKEQKSLRCSVVGRAVRLLRERLSLSQPQLARLIGGDTDAGSVSRWERALLTPHLWKREKLAQLARRRGWTEIADALLDPAANWKATISNRYVLDLITLLEICALNVDIAGLNNAADELFYHALDGVAAIVRDRIVAGYKTGAPVVLLTDEQRKYWFGMIDELGVNPPKGADEPKEEGAR